ncbi:MAG: site-specific integrase [Paracoccaceae bacterium]|nr:site-specific integrase [Paracoccaceae bacterium]
MLHIDPKNLETAFLCPGTLVFADLIAKLQADTGLTPGRQRDLISAIRRTAKALGRPLETIPADPTWLRPRIERIVPAGIGLTPKSWSNVRSDLQAALAHLGITKRPVNRKWHLSPVWAPLWDKVLASGDRTLCASLSRFVYFLSGQGVHPDEVDSAHGLAFRDALALNELSRSPEKSLTNTVSAWNLATARISDWPQQRLSAPQRQKVTKIPLDQLPEPFRQDLDAYVTSLEASDPFAIDGRLAPLQPISIQVYKARLLRFAGALVRSGLPVDALRSLSDLVVPACMEQGLRWMLAQNDGDTTASISETGQLLSGIARRYVKLTPEEQKRVDMLAQRVAMKPQHGLTEKNRTRLRPLRDPTTRRRLLTLPEQLFAQADQKNDFQSAALLRELAVAVGILLYCPIRVKNLASIHLERNLQRPGGGRSFLVFTGTEVKNKHPIELELPKRVADLIDKHCATRSPWLCTPASPWLFPARQSQGSMDPNTLSRSIFRIIRKSIGLDVNAHLFRHLAAMLYLQAHPGEYEAVRRLLGHTQLSRTLNFYAGFEADTATQLLANVVDADRLK